MSEMGKLLIAVGAVLVVVGVVLVFAGRFQLPLGRLPGDIVYRGKHATVFFPLVTCIVVSVVLTLVMWAIGRLRR